MSKYTRIDLHDDDKLALLKLSESLQEQIINRCASKEELNQMQDSIKEYCDDSYVTVAFVEEMLKSYDGRLNDMDTQQNEMMNQFDEMQKDQQDLGDALAEKCDKGRVEKIEQQIERFALYEDYHTLYTKVVPPCERL